MNQEDLTVERNGEAAVVTVTGMGDGSEELVRDLASACLVVGDNVDTAEILSAMTGRPREDFESDEDMRHPDLDELHLAASGGEEDE